MKVYIVVKNCVSYDVFHDDFDTTHSLEKVFLNKDEAIKYANYEANSDDNRKTEQSVTQIKPKSNRTGLIRMIFIDAPEDHEKEYDELEWYVYEREVE